MKLVAALCLTSASALQMGSTARPSATRLRAVEDAVGEAVVAEAPAEVEAPAAIPEPPKPVPRNDVVKNEWYNLALPFVERPAVLACDLAGDSGFDPAGFANSKVELYTYREAEVKHARLAMLAAAGWPVAELWDTGIAKTLGLPSIIEQNGGRDPSVLNGGLGLISPVYWLGVIAFAGVIEFVSETTKAAAKSQDSTWMLTGSWVPGDLKFDPLGLYTTFGDTPKAKMLMEEAEIKNGRLAMIAIVAYVIEEVSSGKPVVELTPLFFEPFWKVVEDLMFAAPPLYAQ